MYVHISQHHVVQNFPLTSKLKFRFGLAKTLCLTSCAPKPLFKPAPSAGPSQNRTFFLKSTGHFAQRDVSPCTCAYLISDNLPEGPALPPVVVVVVEEAAEMEECEAAPAMAAPAPLVAE